jgi:stalled ribosome alternative rescue factor ArfA
MTRRGTKDRDPAVKARAEALFRLKEEQKREGQSAMGDYLEKGKAERGRRFGCVLCGSLHE